MIDLTPLDVRKKRGDFRSRIRGYDPEEVDSFLELVAERFEALVKENLNLSERGDTQATQLTALEEREKAVQEALVTAQKLRDDLKDQTRQEAEVVRKHAEKEADLLKKQAKGEIERRLGGLDSLIRERKEALADLERKRNKFLKSFRSLLERELDGVEVEEARMPLEDIPMDLELGGDGEVASLIGGWVDDEVQEDEDTWTQEPEEETPEPEEETPEPEEETPEPVEVTLEPEEVTPEPEEAPRDAQVSLGEQASLAEQVSQAFGMMEAAEATGEGTEPLEDLGMMEAAEATGEGTEPLEALHGIQALGEIEETPEAEPTPVQDLAPDDGAFETQKFHFSTGSPSIENADAFPPAEEVEGPREDPLIPLPVGEMLVEEVKPAEEERVAEEEKPKEAEVEPTPEQEPSVQKGAAEKGPQEGARSQPVWLSAILKEEEDGAGQDDEDREDSP